MREHYEAQLTTLNTEMIQMGALCEDAISGAIQALLEDDKHLAEKVGRIEMEIDQHERDIERLCMRLLLMQKPVATDLRVVSSALKMISDLERIGDQAFDISDITKHVSFQKYESKVHIKEMANAVIHMVTDSVDSYVKKDAALAKGGCRRRSGGRSVPESPFGTGGTGAFEPGHGRGCTGFDDDRQVSGTHRRPCCQRGGMGDLCHYRRPYEAGVRGAAG